MGNNSFVDTKGKVITGFSAGPGYDLASGWGSLDVAKLIAAWPSCGTSGDGGVLPPPADAGKGGVDAGKSSPDAGKSGADAGGKGPPASGSHDAGGGGKTGAKDAGSHTSSGSTGGCNMTAGRAARSSDLLGGLFALGLVALRRRRRTT